MKALLKNYRQAPRKVRLVTDAVKGKKVKDATTLLSFINKRAALSVKKLIESAVANAEQKGKAVDNLKIDSITVDKGITFKRARARARGTSSPIRKETSHIKIELAEVASSKNNE